MKPQQYESCRVAIVGLLAVCSFVLADDVRAQGSAATDRAALEAVYHAAGGDGWTHNTNWLRDDEPLGEWYGVEVNEHGRVTGLRLGGWDETIRDFIGNGLSGSLTPKLGTLSHLRSLEIGGNRGLAGFIPPELGDLANLDSLSLQNNSLTGLIPAALGQLTKLEGLSLSGNMLSGRVPTELGSLMRLTGLDLRATMLSGPLPEGLTRLSAMAWLQLEGSGLCIPDTPDMRTWLARIVDFTGVICEGSLSFLRLVTQPIPGRFFVLAVADLNGDGRDDIVAGGTADDDGFSPTPAGRLENKTTLRLFLARTNGSFRHAPELVEATIEVRTPIVVAADFNGDARADLAVFDAGVGVYDAERSQGLGYGNPPQLFLSSEEGHLRPSDTLADAVRREHALRPHSHYSGPADLHLKSATPGDIDGDGDIDLWVDSIGGANVSSHFMVNNEDGTFSVDEARAPPALRYNWPEAWYHLHGHLVDLDNDGDLDLALGQNRDIFPSTVNQFSIALLNDGTGHYPARIELPRPAFNEGYTSITGQTHFDVNGDGFQDLLLVHPRNNDALPNVLPFTGRYVQVLVNRGGTTFGDESPARMGDQSATTPERDADGNPLHNAGVPSMHDVDRDGCADLVVSRNSVRTESPLVYGNDGSGRFRAMSPIPFTGSDRYFGHGTVPADLNGDGAIDFVVPRHDNGPDGVFDTADDSTTLVTLLNTTPAGPARCQPRVTVVDTLPARMLYVGSGAVAEVVPVAGAFRHASTYRASSSAPGVATVIMSGSSVTVTPVAPGVTTVTVTATGADNSVATQRFRATVLPATTFSDRLVAETPPRAIHFLELRTRIATLREHRGLPPVRWTDPVLTVGITPVKRVHLTELRDALDGAYDAAGQTRPTYTDSIVTAGMTAIKAVHVTELRNAILALE